MDGLYYPKVTFSPIDFNHSRVWKFQMLLTHKRFANVSVDLNQIPKRYYPAAGRWPRRYSSVNDRFSWSVSVVKSMFLFLLDCSITWISRTPLKSIESGLNWNRNIEKTANKNDLNMHLKWLNVFHWALFHYAALL